MPAAKTALNANRNTHIAEVLPHTTLQVGLTGVRRRRGIEGLPSGEAALKAALVSELLLPTDDAIEVLARCVHCLLLSSFGRHIETLVAALLSINCLANLACEGCLHSSSATDCWELDDGAKRQLCAGSSVHAAASSCGHLRANIGAQFLAPGFRNVEDGARRVLHPHLKARCYCSCNLRCSSKHASL